MQQQSVCVWFASRAMPFEALGVGVWALLDDVNVNGIIGYG